MGRKRNWAVREFFDFNCGKNESSCKVCGSVFRGSYSANLTRHLKSNHNVIYEETYRKSLEDNDADAAAKAQQVKFSVQFSVSEIQDACVQLVTAEALPFSFFDTKPFKFLTEQIFSGLNMDQINSTNIMSLVANKYDLMRDNLKKLIENKIISIKIDIAIRLNRRILAINVQFIKNNQIFIKTLDIIELYKSYTANNIKSKIENVFIDYNIDLNQIYTITITNNVIYDSRNVIDEKSVEFFEKLTNNLNFENIISMPCSAHTLQLIMKDFLFLSTDNERLIDKLRQIAKILRTSTYRNILHDFSLSEPELDVPTRWISTFKMIQEVLEIRAEQIVDLLEIFNKLSANEWFDIEKLVNVLEPVHETAMKLQKTQLFLGDFYKVWTGLKLQLAASQNTLSTQIIKIFEKREVPMMENSAIISALYLDPRIRPFLRSTKRQAAKIYLKNLALKMININKKTNTDLNFANDPLIIKSENESSLNTLIDDTSSNNPPIIKSENEISIDPLIYDTSSPNISSLLRDSLQNISDEDSEDEQQQSAEILAASCEIESFSPKRIDIDSSIMEFWKDNKYLYPFLSKLAKVVHGVPATQVSVEKCSSALEIVLGDLRYNLSEQNMKKVIFVKLNDPIS